MSRLEKGICILYICLVIIMGQVTTYYDLKYNTLTFYKFLTNKEVENKEVENKEVIEEKEEKCVHKQHGQVVNVESNLAFREEPNISSHIHYGLYKGMTFDILDKSGDWYKIEYDHITGYVNKDYIEEYDNDPHYPVYDQISSKTAKDITDKYEVIKAELTAYCNDAICSGGWKSKTAMQTHTRPGVIAAPKNIPMGSKMYIPSLKYYKDDGVFYVEDRGGAIVVKDDGTYVIDVWLPSHEQVIKFGRQKVNIYLMK